MLRPGGLACTRCGGADARVHRRYGELVLDFRFTGCGAVDNAFTGTGWRKTHLRPGQSLLILSGFAQRRSTAGLARELGANAATCLGAAMPPRPAP